MTNTDKDALRARDERGRFISEYRDVKKHQVTVWDSRDGDIVEKLWEASEAEVDEIEERYRDEPFMDVQVEYL